MSDLFDHYKRGIDYLLESLGKDHPDYDNVLAQRHRLLENIEKVELHHDNEMLKSERSEIIFNLDKITLHSLEKPFHKLYELNEQLPLNRSSRQATSLQEQKQEHAQKPEQATLSDANAHNKRVSIKHPQVDQQNNRNILINIAYTLDTAKREYISDEFIKHISTMINGVHIWLRSSDANTQTFIGGKEIVLTYLRNAAINLSVAIAEYSKRGPSTKFFKEIEASRNALERAIYCC